MFNNIAPCRIPDHLFQRQHPDATIERLYSSVDPNHTRDLYQQAKDQGYEAVIYQTNSITHYCRMWTYEKINE